MPEVPKAATSEHALGHSGVSWKKLQRRKGVCTHSRGPGVFTVPVYYFTWLWRPPNFSEEFPPTVRWEWCLCHRARVRQSLHRHCGKVKAPQVLMMAAFNAYVLPSTSPKGPTLRKFNHICSLEPTCFPGTINTPKPELIWPYFIRTSCNNEKC